MALYVVPRSEGPSVSPRSVRQLFVCSNNGIMVGSCANRNGMGFRVGPFRFQAGRARFPAGRKIIKLARSAALKPTAARDLESRSKPCLGRLFPKKKTLKVNRHFNERNKRKVKSAFFAFFDFIFPGEGQYGTVYRATATGLRGQVQPCKVLRADCVLSI